MAIKVLNITTDDFANFSHDNAKALRSVGVDCMDVKLEAHDFGYETESNIVDNVVMRELCRSADIIQIMHSDPKCLNMVIGREIRKNTKIVVYHTGSRYRSRPKYYNTIFNRIVDLSFIALGEFAGLGAKNEHYIVGAIDVKKTLKFGHEIKRPYKIAHYPSNAEVKGTNKILDMIGEVNLKGAKLFCSTEIVDHKKQQKRMNACDIYIELFKPELHGKPYGSWGITALEAAAAGKIVVTQNLNWSVYEKEYGACMLAICNNEYSFIEQIKKLIKFDSDVLSLMQTATYNWVKNNHSYEATGNKLKTILNGL